MRMACLATILLCGICAASLAADISIIRIGGGGAACETAFTPVAKSFMAKTGIRLAINPTTPGQGLIELNDERIDVAASAHPFEWMVRKAAESGVIVNPNLFRVYEIGASKTLVFTHRTNKVKKLSRKQLKEIFTGRITNWKSVGGADMPVVVIWGLATPGQNDLFSRQILDNKPIVKNYQEATDYRKIRDMVARTPGGIAIDPQGFVSNKTNNPQIPVIVSTMIAVTKGPASPQIEKLLTHVKNSR